MLCFHEFIVCIERTTYCVGLDVRQLIIDAPRNKETLTTTIGCHFNDKFQNYVSTGCNHIRCVSILSRMNTLVSRRTDERVHCANEDRQISFSFCFSRCIFHGISIFQLSWNSIQNERSQFADKFTAVWRYEIT